MLHHLGKITPGLPPMTSPGGPVKHPVYKLRAEMVSKPSWRCYKLPSRGVWVIQTGNERENGCKTGSAHDSSRDLALGAEQPGAHPSACSELDGLESTITLIQS